MNESKLIDLQSKVDGKFVDLIKIMITKERKDKKFAVDYMNSIYEIVHEIDSEGISPLEAFEMSRRKADEAAVFSYRPESESNPIVQARPMIIKEKRKNGCLHENKAEEDFMIKRY